MKTSITITSSSLLISLILCFTLLDIATAFSSPSPAPSPSGFCDVKCGYRCQRWGKESKCMHFCKMCCDKCQCVPSGTSGNKDECPCYRDWISKQGKPKCP